MIQIGNEKETVNVKLIMSIGWHVQLNYPRHNEMDAILLRNQLQKDINKKIESIRRDAYELGWKEAKSKKTRKRDWFNGNINSDMV